MMEIAEHAIGGARVRRTFSRGDALIKAGSWLSAEEVCRIPIANRRALTDANYIEIFPRAPIESVGERHIVHLGRGQYDVIEGRKLNEAPLSKDEAEELATRPN